ncbi:MAG TPA: hypothetical protein VKD72_14180 [Gemmataceae bacterium]|nr:hypothetical protein [Gemmataceae bacterium]
MSSSPTSTGERPWGRKRVVLLAGLILLTALVLHAPRVAFPMLGWDDFWFLRDSWTWSAAWNNLWQPINDHAMPLSRVTTRLLVGLSGCAAALPYVLGLQGPLVVLACMGLLYLFLRRELGHPVYGLVGMAAFGVTSRYEQAVSWYCATFMLVSLAFILLALLAAQRWHQRRRLHSLLACMFWTAAAATCFSGGVLGGPLVALYLLLPPSGAPAPQARTGWRWRSLLPPLAPLLGTALFLAVSLPRTAKAILHAEHYEGKTALEAFHPGKALVYSCRSLVDNLFLGSFGISGVTCYPFLVALLLMGLLWAAVWWWRGAPHRRLLLLGLAFIFSSYFLIYGARSEWPYEQMIFWSRYQVFSHLGLVLFLAGGLPRWEGWLVAGTGRWAPAQNRIWLTALLAFWVIQMPRTLPFRFEPQQHVQLRRLDEIPLAIGRALHLSAQQHAQLRLLDEMDARCRRYHIDAASARAVLPPLELVDCDEPKNGWDFLRGSDDPHPIDPAEVRRLLQP